MTTIQPAVYFDATYGGRAATVLKRMYIWHKQKATHALKHGDAYAVAHHNAMMAAIDYNQKALRSL